MIALVLHHICLNVFFRNVDLVHKTSITPKNIFPFLLQYKQIFLSINFIEQLSLHHTILSDMNFTLLILPLQHLFFVLVITCLRGRFGIICPSAFLSQSSRYRYYNKIGHMFWVGIIVLMKAARHVKIPK